MNKDFSELWEAQPLVQHDHERLKKMCRHRRNKDRLSYAFATFMMSFTLGFSVYVGNGDANIISKIWSIFWSILCCGYFAGYLYFMRTNILSVREESNTSLIQHMRQRAIVRLNSTKIVKPIAILILLLQVAFGIAYLAPSEVGFLESPKFVFNNLLILGIAVVVWFYANRKIKSYVSEVEWLDKYQTEGE